MVRAEYDQESDGLYIWLGPEKKAAETVEIDQVRNVDLDQDGQPIGIEVLGMANYAIDDLAKRFGFEDRVPLINFAVGMEVGKSARPLGARQGYDVTTAGLPPSATGVGPLVRS
jgi:uncharacterized protein YuzE